MNAISVHFRNETVTQVTASEGLVQHCEKSKISLIKTSASGCVYEDILTVRRQLNDRSRADAISPDDQGTDLYCAYVDGMPVGTIRVARACQTQLDCEEYYPQELLNKFRNNIGTASHFAVLQNLDPSLKLAKVIIESAWEDQIKNGYRIDVINAHERGVSYYQRLGYKVVEGSFFIHPRLGTPSYVLVLVADPSGNSSLKHCFQGVADPITEADLESQVTLTTMKPRRRRARNVRAA